MTNPEQQAGLDIPEELREIYEGIISKSKEEIALEYARLLYVLENAVPDIKDFILGIGRKMRVVRRDWQAYIGYLIGFEADIIKLKLDVSELIRRYDQKTDLFEKKVVEIPSGSIVLWEWIEEEAEVPKQEG